MNQDAPDEAAAVRATGDVPADGANGAAPQAATAGEPDVAPALTPQLLLARMRQAMRSEATDTWELVEARLRRLEERASVADTVSPMTTFPRLVRPLARATGRLVLFLSRFITDAQVQFNLAALRAVRGLAQQVRRLEATLLRLHPESALERSEMDALLAAMHEQFRGPREQIVERLRVYLPFLERAAAATGARTLLDVGCGRGELLSVTRDAGWQARGVDTNAALLAACRAEALQVIEEDALVYLASCPTASVAVVAAVHVIEHLPFERFVALIDEAIRVLRPGGLLLLETPNPQNVLVGAATFFADPTHRRPLPSPVVAFVVEARGLRGIDVLPLHPVAGYTHASSADAADGLKEYFQGPRDYAVLAWKL